MLAFYFIEINKNYLETTLYKFLLTFNVISKKKYTNLLTALGVKQNHNILI